MANAFFCLTLHAHLPYVRHPERRHALEERWLFEALTETYLPLTQAMQRWMSEGLAWRLTLSVSPTLLSMLTDPLLQLRYRAHLDALIQLAETETTRLAQDPEYGHLPAFYLQRLTALRADYDDWGHNLPLVWRTLATRGHLELITTAATHAFLPLVLTEAAMRAQIDTAVRCHTETLGQPPRGIWLPECAYRPGVDKLLRDYGVTYFFVDDHAVMSARPAPSHGVYAPVWTPDGIAVFARDPDCAKQVWSAHEGYPGDFDYREFYRDIGYERPMQDLFACLPEGVRVDTGLKYWRITGKTETKAAYSPQRAHERAVEHARHFLTARLEQVQHLCRTTDRPPVINAVYDAELFGHWWYEGPDFLDALIRQMQSVPDDFVMATPSQCLAEGCAKETSQFAMSSWGRNGWAEVWCNPANDWLYPELHEMERIMVELARLHTNASGQTERALNQAARELMLAQASDWAFILDHQTAADYAERRSKLHMQRFWRIAEMIATNSFDERYLTAAEQRDSLFPSIDYRVYALDVSASTLLRRSTCDGPTVLMLAWEYPPLVVGGLARHVSALAEALVVQGWQVHVITRSEDGRAQDDLVNGVYVHRVDVLSPKGDSFLDWVVSLNLAMLDRARQLMAADVRVDILHAHDWLVQYAAKALKEIVRLPLLCTIHATEHGRNGGLFTDLQRRIHAQELALTAEAARVIVCSEAMRQEVCGLYNLPQAKVTMIPNGVLLPPVAAEPSQRIPAARPTVVFVGRLVYEKGVQVLLQAIPRVRAAVPDIRVVVMGRGPLESELQALAHQLALDDTVTFRGFVSDAERELWLQSAHACVIPSLYEPFGMVALEAMAAGIPVVASCTGGLREIVEHNVTGLTAIPGNAESLAHQLVRMLTEPKLAQTVADRALCRLRERYTWDRIAQRTVEQYEWVRQTAYEEVSAG